MHCTCTGQERKRQPGLQATCASDPSTHAVSRSHCGLVTNTRTYAPGPISSGHSSQSLSPSYWLAQLRPFARRCDSDAESQVLARELRATWAGSKRSLLPRQCASLTRTSLPRGQCQCIHGLRLNLQASSVFPVIIWRSSVLVVRPGSCGRTKLAGPATASQPLMRPNYVTAAFHLSANPSAA